MVRTQRAEMAPPRRTQDLVGLGMFFVGAACLLWMTWAPQNGLVGPAIDAGCRWLAGTGCYAVPVILMFVGTMLLVGYERFSFSHATYGTLLLFLTYCTFRHAAVVSGSFLTVDDMLDPRLPEAGGCIGGVLGTVFLKLFGTIGSYVFLAMMACMGVVLVADRPFIEILRTLRKPVDGGIATAGKGIAAVKERRQIAREAKAERAALPPAPAESGAGSAEQRPRRGLVPFLRGSGGEKPETDLPAVVTPDAPTAGNGAGGGRKAEPAAGSLVRTDGAGRAQQLALPTGGPAEPGAFALPPLDLLKEASSVTPKRAQQEMADHKQVLERTLDEFGIQATVVEIAHGPTVTRYEIRLAPGIKVAKIVSLADNLAMALAAQDVRVEAPIPGKSAIGVEVPNQTPSVVSLRECLQSSDFQNAQSKLTFVLGKDVSGLVKCADLAKMPHLLVAGATNSGKSVCLNAIIASFLYRATPREVQFLMIDPKRVELSLWDGIPNLMYPVVKDVKQAAGLFRSALKEMERRYDLFSRIGTRNIDGYNQKVDEEDRLPYVVIVVDELADLMMQAAAEIETSICRLAQLARATGIHLVIATQRPSVDVITGLIKANISSRIAFAVSSQVDSRTILDQNGAERLLGRGDMLFLPIDASKPARIQGCYLSEQETNSLVAYLREQEAPSYSMSLADSAMSAADEDDDEDEDDDLFEAAVKLVVTNGQCSTSMLQRKFKIGYTRAARLVDVMERRGIVGPLGAAGKPREILISRDEVDRMFAL